VTNATQFLNELDIPGPATIGKKTKSAKW